ncbi:MAG: DUF1844 domain-containing protein [Candidatus Omnitrophota bacterium]
MDEKHVDESWKEQVEKDKVGAHEEPESQAPEQEMPPVSFALFISSLGMQALMSLGEIENPMTNQKEVDINQAKYLIDTMEMLAQKTTGNLSEEENKIVDQLLYELRMKFISLNK